MDTPFEIDFASLKSQAADMLDAPDTAPVVDVTPIVEAAPAVVDTPVAAPAKSDTPAVTPPTLEELDPETHGDRLVRVKVDGQWEVKALKDVTAGYSRTSHFTRQMQDLAKQRAEVEGFQQNFRQLQEERGQIQNFLRNPQLVAQFLQQSNPELFHQANQPVQGDPNEIATVQQARDLVAQQQVAFEQRLKAMDAAMNERMVATGREIENKRETAVYIDSINTVVRDIFEKNPILGKIRMSEDIIRFEVGKMNPKNITEALDAFRTVAQGMVEDINEGFATTNKTKIATAAKLATARIEPPGGSGPQIQPTTNFKKADGSIDWKALKNAAANLE
jgi:hypothetical protein